ncbi:hypothetical protein TPHA_0B01210 [Tetrapisispora phaffii CBS 4417]|uniref:Uncharacterized protein n=1 Tax=Tetrapisispora phaffii (strain ATCC 24235 / CBS 4417 / NBRC 1672 / NRRL Y-8282 / UCD 70-5) TaxID=1071381 RepID=G8BP62_TETPH|nr:hypothetical protein TPHA_0B01210 [Tetrapisispora phaffii CBS 4417]CCE61793.1 hypothetical protein TPHA_0B01210 [Tetrapisispora phaffii CBS 4417]
MTKKHNSTTHTSATVTEKSYSSPTLHYIGDLSYVKDNKDNKVVEKYTRLILDISLVQTVMKKISELNSKYKDANNKYYLILEQFVHLVDQLFFVVIIQNGIQQFNNVLVNEKNNKLGLWCIRWFYKDYLYTTLLLNLFYKQLFLSLKKEKYDVLINDLNKKYSDKLSQNDNNLPKTIINTGIELGSTTIKKIRQTASI